MRLQKDMGASRNQPVLLGADAPSHVTALPPAAVCIHCNAMRDEIAALRKALGLEGKASNLLALRKAYGLTDAQARLLLALYDAAGSVVPNYTLARVAVKDKALFFGSDALKVHICHLRSRLGGEIIETVRGEGYAITDPGRALVTAALTVHREAA